MPSTAARTIGALPAWVPTPPHADALDETQVHVGIGVMATLLTAAVVDGWRTAGRGRLYQDVQLTFGLHGFGHLAAAALSRGYSSGVATSPTVVLPQLWWARRRLRDARVPDASSLARGAVLLGSWVVAAHTIGHAASTRGKRRTEASR